MTRKCPSCGHTWNPLKVFDKDGDSFKLATGGIKNLFKMDFMSIVFIIIIIYLVVAFKIDTAKCEDAYTNPCDFCNKSGCYQYVTKGEYNYNKIARVGIYNQSLPLDNVEIIESPVSSNMDDAKS